MTFKPLSATAEPNRMSTMVRFPVALLACCAFALALASSAQAAAPGVFFSESPSEAQIAEAKEAGAKNMRWFLSWADAEPTDDAFSDGVFSTYANVATKASAEGIRPIVVLMFTPAWANGNRGATVPPDNPAEFAEFAGETAKRLKDAGVLYEIWNEQDEDKFFAGAPGNASHYVAMLKGAYAAIHANDPTAIVNLGPLTGGNVGYLKAMYDLGAKDFFDGISVHLDHEGNKQSPYHYYRDQGGPGVLPEQTDLIGRFSFLAFRELWKVAQDRGDAPADIPALRASFSDLISRDSLFIAITEFGRSASTWAQPTPSDLERGHFWPDYRNEADDPEIDASGRPDGEKQQAKFLKRGLHCAQAYPYVKIANWFSLRDNPNAGTYADYGLIGADKRPSWFSFNTFATGGDQMASVCGDFERPVVTVSTVPAAVNGVVPLPTGQSLKITVGATDNRRVKRVSYEVAGKDETFTAGADQDTASGTRDLQSIKTTPPGDYVLKATAVDVYGNVGATSLPVKVGAAAPNGGKTRFGSAIKVTHKGNLYTAQFQIGAAGSTLRAIATAAQVAGLPGKVRVEWAHYETYKKKVGKKRKKVRGYRQLHKGLKNASTGKVKASQRLKKKGRWRVRAVYLGSGSFKKSTSKWKNFKR